MAQHTDLNAIAPCHSRLGPETVFKGKLRFKESVRIGGRYEGEIEAAGFLFVEEGATVKADVTADHIIVGGTIHGNVVAREEIEMLPSCKLYGNVKAGRIRIADGVVFEGKCEMIRNSSSVDIFAAPLEKLREEARPVVD